jgi:ADP-heptose:LPS heptosyltransferase
MNQHQKRKPKNQKNKPYRKKQYGGGPIVHVLRKKAFDIEQSSSVRNHGRIKDALIGLKFEDGHRHIHYPTDDIAQEMAIQIMEDKLKKVDSEAKIDNQKIVRKIVLREGHSPGDILTFTRVVEDLKKSYPHWQIDVRSPAGEIWENCPHLTKLDEDAEDVEVYDVAYEDIHISGWNGLHFTDAFRHDIEQKLGVKIKKTGIRPVLWVSDLEKSWINQVEQDLGWHGPFWVINAGRKQDNELKQYHRWEEVVDILNWYFKGKVKIVQIGLDHPEHIHPPLKDTLNLVGKTDNRQMIRLMWWAHGSIGPLSFQYVISSALEQPAVCVVGGKEGMRWHMYPHIQYVYTNGAIDCCAWDGCWLGGDKGKCKHLEDDVPRCFRMIKPHMIADRVKMFYEGGYLSMDDRRRPKQ